MKQLLIIGAGGHAKVVAEAAIASGHWTHIACLDDYHPPGTDLIPNQVQVLGPCAQASAYLNAFPDVCVALGDNQTRLSLCNEMQGLGFALATVIHPSAYISPSAHLGAGTVVLPLAVVHSGARVGKGCIINTAAVVEHDCALDEGVHIAPNATLAGQVRVGALSHIGMGSCVKENVRIGAGVMVGAGSVVLQPISDTLVVYGNPAKEGRRHDTPTFTD